MAESSNPAQHRVDNTTTSTSQVNQQLESDVSAKQSTPMPTSGSSVHPDSDKERVKMQALVASFSESQLNRYEMYRRASFPKAAIRRLMQSIMSGGSVPPNVVIAMAGIAKVYVGEICEEALDIMEERSESGPIQPKHIREAVRRMKRHSLIPNSRLLVVNFERFVQPYGQNLPSHGSVIVRATIKRNIYMSLRK